MRLWDAYTGAESWKFDGHSGSVYCVTFNHDSTRIATSSGAGSLRVFSVQERRLLHQVKAHDHARCCAFSGDSRLIASGGDSGILILFDAETFAEVRRITHPPAPYIFCVDFDPSSRYIATGTRKPHQGRGKDRVHVFEVVTGEEVLRFYRRHQFGILSLSWSSCRNLLASASQDKTVRIHDVSHLKYRRRRATHAVVVEVVDGEVEIMQ